MVASHLFPCQTRFFRFFRFFPVFSVFFRFGFRNSTILLGIVKFLHHLVAWLNPFPPGTSKRASAIDCPEVSFVQKNIEKTKKNKKKKQYLQTLWGGPLREKPKKQWKNQKKQKKNNIYKLFGEGPYSKTSGILFFLFFLFFSMVFAFWASISLDNTVFCCLCAVGLYQPYLSWTKVFVLKCAPLSLPCTSYARHSSCLCRGEA